MIDTDSKQNNAHAHTFTTKNKFDSSQSQTSQSFYPVKKRYLLKPNRKKNATSDNQIQQIRSNVYVRPSCYCLCTVCLCVYRPRLLDSPHLYRTGSRRWMSSRKKYLMWSYVAKLIPTAMGPLIQFMLSPL